MTCLKNERNRTDRLKTPFPFSEYLTVVQFLLKLTNATCLKPEAGGVHLNRSHSPQPKIRPNGLLCQIDQRSEEAKPQWTCFLSSEFSVP